VAQDVTVTTCSRRLGRWSAIAGSARSGSAPRGTELGRWLVQHDSMSTRTLQGPGTEPSGRQSARARAPEAAAALPCSRTALPPPVQQSVARPTLADRPLPHRRSATDYPQILPRPSVEPSSGSGGTVVRAEGSNEEATCLRQGPAAEGREGLAHQLPGRPRRDHNSRSPGRQL